MDYRQINELDRMIKKFTPEQMEAVNELTNLWQEYWSRIDLVIGIMNAKIPELYHDALELAFDDCATGPRETSDALDLVMENIFFKAACYKVAIDQRDFQPEPDDDDAVAELLGGSYGSFPIKHNDIASPKPVVGPITPAA